MSRFARSRWRMRSRRAELNAIESVFLFVSGLRVGDLGGGVREGDVLAEEGVVMVEGAVVGL